MRIGVVYSDYYKDIIAGMIDGVKKASKGKDVELEYFSVMGSFEIPLKVQQVNSDEYDGFIALGCIIEGETYHNHMIADSVAKGLMDLSLSLNKPVGLGVLSVKNMEQAVHRSGLENNKGAESFEAVHSFLTSC